LATQERICRQWCDQRGMTVERVFVDEGESAKTASRPAFQEMLAHLRKNKATVAHVVVYRFDRFARNVLDDLNVRKDLGGLGIELHSTQETTDESPFGKLARLMVAGVAELDNAVRAERPVGGMKARVADGRWCWKAPHGYVCTGRRGKGVSLTPDVRVATLIADLFGLVGSGRYRPHDALARVTAHGLTSQHGKTISLGTALNMLRSPVYCGRLELPKWGVSMKGDWEGLVSEELFARVQRVLDGKAAETTTPTPRADDRFPLRGFVRCAFCDKALTGSVSKGQSGTGYAYYHCMKKNHVRVRAEKLEVDWLTLLDRTQPRPGKEHAVLRIFQQEWEAANASSESAAAVKAIKERLAELERQKANLLHLGQMGSLAGADFDEAFRKVKDEIHATQEQLALATQDDVDVETAIDFMVHLFWNSGTLWQTSNLETRQGLQKAIFPGGLKYGDDTGFGTALSDFYTVVSEQPSRGQNEMVRPERFELPAY
jgi:site-specific DNA recombinase